MMVAFLLSNFDLICCKDRVLLFESLFERTKLWAVFGKFVWGMCMEL
ncbi:hypothetical protein Lalb_Chr14g0366481 [Lupinus albus]|uniref:Uncharacterized protein n=1 Tax=Lupinus albus TaxID=3870 RepID=A0A6A4P9M3_LUPAL|nr:hypothetical protein Lalb_Chr14g0366481 [Lupinus albus]